MKSNTPRLQFLSQLICCALAVSTSFADAKLDKEPFRPQFHFTPERNWINDPNGLVYFNGEYHLFYQYNPKGDTWGHMSWGHAVSKDLTKWTRLPVALPETGDIMMFSGSAVVDTKNTAGFGKDALVAIYTGHNEKAKRQDQRLAYSTDKGRTWIQYRGNPVLDIKNSDFRDPKVFWYEPSGKWIMAVAMSTKKTIQFYSSPNLKNWSFLSEFGPAGATGGLWECPDLFELATEKGEKRWILLVNINPGAPNGGSGCQYFIGNFDGKEFHMEDTNKSTSSSNATNDNEVVLADFEDFDFVNWTATEGEAFKNGPIHPDPTSDLRGYVGHGLLDTLGGRDDDHGVLVSKDFVITADNINFRIGGGNHPEHLMLNLIVDNNVVRTATGNNSAELMPMSWDVAEFRNKTARLEIVDRYEGTDWGHLLVDHIVMGGQPLDSTQGSKSALWVDYGKDFYAAVSWSDIPPADGRRIIIGWMSNWDYANQLPTEPWRGAMTIPRSLKLVDTSAGIRLSQTPITELAGLREGDAISFSGGSFAEAADWLSSHQDLPELLDVEMEFSEVSNKTPFDISIRTETGEEVLITIDPEAKKLIVDRSKSGEVNFHPTFAGHSEAPLEIEDGKFTIRWILDTSSIEIFTQDGVTVLTNLIFPTAPKRNIYLSLRGETSPHINYIKIHKLSSAFSK